MTIDKKYPVCLTLDWPNSLRRNETGFSTIKNLVATQPCEHPYRINAFLYASLCTGKNLDLFLEEDLSEIKPALAQIADGMEKIEELEREGAVNISTSLRDQWLAIRKIAARANVRDELRVLSTLLFSGPSQIEEIATDLGISANLVERILQAIEPVLASPVSSVSTHGLSTDTNSLTVVIYLLKTTLGIDPAGILQRRLSIKKRGHE